MRTEELRELIKKTPFQPFRLFLSNGQSYDVTHPDLAMVGRNDLILGLPASDIPAGVFDRFVFVALMRINNIEPLPPASHAEKNGPA
jgi:hypothetical protein